MKPSPKPPTLHLRLNPPQRISRGRIIATITIGNRIHALHATKGWRTYLT